MTEKGSCQEISITWTRPSQTTSSAEAEAVPAPPKSRRWWLPELTTVGSGAADSPAFCSALSPSHMASHTCNQTQHYELRFFALYNVCTDWPSGLQNVAQSICLSAHCSAHHGCRGQLVGCDVQVCNMHSGGARRRTRLVLCNEPLKPAALVQGIKVLAALSTQVTRAYSCCPSQTAGTSIHMIQPVLPCIRLARDCAAHGRCQNTEIPEQKQTVT